MAVTLNFIDVNIFNSFFALVDNNGNKNTYCVLNENKNLFNFIVWDTDLSFGVSWSKNGRYYSYDLYTIDLSRVEYSFIKSKIKSLNEEINNRWKSLRKNMYSKDNVNALIDETINTINKSCSYQRDIEQWGFIDDGIDKQENIKKWINDRIEYLDSYYKNKDN